MNKILNVQVGYYVKQIACQYDDKNDTFRLGEDIIVNDWKIKGTIKHVRCSGYDAYYEYVISDKLGKEKIKAYYYTGRAIYHPNECGLKGSIDASPQGVLSYFINNSPIFKCKDWDEYESHMVLYKIQKIIENGHSKQEQLNEIRKILTINI